tara:strand:+ start:514 stop:1062 length:549 start_codon:yes stop_codon:yes gene_type:complete
MALKGLSNFLKDFNSFKKQNSYNKTDLSKKRNSNALEVFDFLSLVKVWPEIVGPKLSNHTLPVKNSRGVLTVLTDHPAYGQELSFLQTVLIKKIESYFPSLKNKVTRLLFQNDPTFFKTKTEMMAKIAKAPSPQMQEDKKKFHPHSPEVKAAKAEALANFSHIEDEDIKKSLTSLYVQMKLK